jgi:hypothetical protein
MKLLIHVEVSSVAKLKNSAETIIVDFDGVVLSDYSRVVKFSMDLVLSQSMFDVICFEALAPVVVEVMDFASDFFTVFEVKCFVDFGVASSSKEGEDEVSIFENLEWLSILATIL